jgi:hypothetical protein
MIYSEFLSPSLNQNSGERSYFTIKRALPNMFHYLTNSKIPSTTNGIEGFFSHLKNHLDLHRGMTIKHRANFIKWYIYQKKNEFFLPIKLTKKSKVELNLLSLLFWYKQNPYC